MSGWTSPCFQCRYYRDVSPAAPVTVGVCRRHAPTLAPAQVIGDLFAPARSVFPPVDAWKDTCGDGEPECR